MVTAIYSLSQVHGAELWLLFWFMCLVAYLILCFVIKCNRTTQGRKNVFIGLLVAEVAVDFIWAIITTVTACTSTMVLEQYMECSYGSRL